jgi:hypothetical protein
MNLSDGIKTLLGTSASCEWQRIPILAGPVLKANCPIWDPTPVAFPSPLPSSRQHVYLHTNDINVPTSFSVGHNGKNKIYYIFSCDFQLDRLHRFICMLQ